jgi:hypothetical protein
MKPLREWRATGRDSGGPHQAELAGAVLASMMSAEKTK